MIEKLLPTDAAVGHKSISRRWIIDAIFYWVRTGWQWRYQPKCFPHWNTVLDVFRAWRIRGLWQRIRDQLREAVRKRA